MQPKQMKSNARDEILARLRRGSRRPVPPRPALPPLRELSLDLEGLISRFSENLTLAGRRGPSYDRHGRAPYNARRYPPGRGGEAGRRKLGRRCEPA